MSLQAVTTGCLGIAGLGAERRCVTLSPTLSPAPLSPPPGLLLLGCYSPLARAPLSAKLVQLLPFQAGF